jgi:hypothetical protein
METQPASKAISTGICTFCKGEFAKNKMTQHLKSCKQRRASIATREEKSQEAKTRLFHILAEGRYNPQYWLHFEMPASETLWSLDDFLKDMWIDDLDHLSGFTINGTDYSTDYPDDYFLFEGEEEGEGKGEEEKEEEEVTEEPQVGEIIDEIISMYSTAIKQFSEPTDAMETALAAWVAEIKKPRSTDGLIDYLKEEELPKLEQERRRIRKQEKEMSSEEWRRASFMTRLEKTIVESILEEIEDRSMEVSLARVLKVGQKFSYIYDYGSSTYINLKVLGEREGIVQDEKDTVQLLAQNTAPEFACIVCGKPATTVALGYYGESIADSVYCEECTEEQEEGRTLPIINSPRVGVL